MAPKKLAWRTTSLPAAMSSTSREQILADIRRQLPAGAPLPAHEGPWTRYADPQRQFLDVLAAVGGKGMTVAGADALRSQVGRIAADLKAKQIFSALPAIPGNVGWESIDDPADLADVDLAIAPGELAVAENAAVWVTDAPLPQRSAYFLAQHLVLVVPADRLVHNMHEAYAWLARQSQDGRPFAEPMFGAFLSGPSKTADIEQALVIGAHGPRSLHVLMTME
jgi:L-lactate dehydrogenase complex protein LldG